MKQAHVLSEKEEKRVLAVIAAGTHAERNRTMFLLSIWAGMRVKELRSIRVGDVYDTNGKPRAKLFLDASQTKGKHSYSRVEQKPAKGTGGILCDAQIHEPRAPSNRLTAP